MAQDIDWSGLRAAAISLNSVQEAARRAARNLPPAEQQRFIERVNKRGYRERWLEASKQLAATAPSQGKPLSNIVQSGADVLATRLADDSKATRIGLSTAARKAATTFGRKTGQGVIKEAQALRHVTAAAAQLHGWEDGKQGGITLNLGLVLGGMQ